MSFNIELTENFKKEAKKLAGKYASFREDLAGLIAELEENPKMGTSLGKDIYKIRMAITSKNKGKSGGARVMSYAKISNGTVLLFSIYEKGDKDTITDKEIKALLKEYI